MNFNNFTLKAQEAVQKAQEIAEANNQQGIDTGHLLKGMLLVDENVVGHLLKKLNANINRLNQELDETIEKYPRVTGAGQTYLSNEANTALQKSFSIMKEFKDEFVSVEHMLLGILAGNDKTASLLREVGVSEKELKSAI